MSAQLHEGQVIHGFAGGAFGRDSYRCRKVEAVGRGWIVTRTPSGALGFTTAPYRFDPEDLTYCGDEFGCTEEYAL